MIAYPREIPRGTRVSEGALVLGDVLDTLVETMETVDGRWGQLPAVYVTPDAQAVYDAMYVPDNLVGDLHQVVEAARDALEAFAVILSGLNAQRPGLVSDVDRYFAMSPSDPGFAELEYDLDSRLGTFDIEFAIADEDCARALGDLRMFVQSPLTDIIPGIDASGPVRDALEAYLSQLAQTAEATPQTTTVTTVINRQIVTLVDIIPDEIVDGTAYSYNARGILVPTGTMTGLLLAPPRGIVVVDVTITSTNLHGAAPVIPTWLRRGSRVFAGLGFPLAALANGTDHYNELLLEEPGLSDVDRFWESVNYGIVVGTAESLGAMGGAALLAVGLGTAGLLTGPGAPFFAVGGAMAGGYFGGEAGAGIGEVLWDWTHP